MRVGGIKSAPDEDTRNPTSWFTNGNWAIKRTSDMLTIHNMQIGCWALSTLSQKQGQRGLWTHVSRGTGVDEGNGTLYCAFSMPSAHQRGYLTRLFHHGAVT